MSNTMRLSAYKSLASRIPECRMPKEDVEWLIKQAEVLEEVKSFLSYIENSAVKDEILSIIKKHEGNEDE